MKYNKTIIIAFFLSILFCSVYYFIKINNDHLECETIVTTNIDKNGNSIVRESHLCKEEFAF